MAHECPKCGATKNWKGQPLVFLNLEDIDKFCGGEETKVCKNDAKCLHHETLAGNGSPKDMDNTVKPAQPVKPAQFSCPDCGATTNQFGYPFIRVPSSWLSHYCGVTTNFGCSRASNCLHHPKGNHSTTPTPPKSYPAKCTVDGCWFKH